MKKKLEKIIHPIVREKKETFIKNLIKSLIVSLDVPLLYETGTDKKCDYVFLVNTTKKIRKKSFDETEHD